MLMEIEKLFHTGKNNIIDVGTYNVEAGIAH